MDINLFKAMRDHPKTRELASLVEKTALELDALGFRPLGDTVFIDMTTLVAFAIGQHAAEEKEKETPSISLGIKLAA